MPEHTIAENLTRLQNATTAIGNAITAKGGTVGANDGLEDFASDIATIPSGGGGGSQPRKDINFYDYDGTIVNSYTAAEFAELSAMPANPTHEGLTAQGWNWSLADAKTYVTAYDKLDVGQMYASNTTDNKTYLHIRLSEGRLKPYLGLTGNSVGTEVSIDWGDGSTTENVTLDTSTVYTPHVYASNGEYVISIAVTNGTISLNATSSSTNLFRKSSSANANNDKVYAHILIKAELATGVTSIGNNAFNDCLSLQSIILPSSLTSIGNSAFNGCFSLTSITMPNSLTSIGDSSFFNCFSLTSITMPNSLTSIGDNAFNSCYSLSKAVFSNSVASISKNLFQNCYNLSSITIPSSVTSMGIYSFDSCLSLTSIILPNSLTSISSYAFRGCSSLPSIILPNSITSVAAYLFNNSLSLTSITIPSSVTSIGGNAFNGDYGIGFIKFESTTPPTVTYANTWTGVPTDCIIYVPSGTLSDYTTASNYPSSSTYTYVEY